MQSVSTPYVLLSCNLEKRPPPPQTDVKTKVAVITPAMLGRFVDTDKEADDQTTFKKQVIDRSNDSVCLASRIAIVHLAESLLQFKPSLLLLPKKNYVSSHTDPVPIAGSDAARDAAGTEEARRGASQ